MLDLALLLSTAAFILVGSAVGVRLLLLAARTRELPDLIVGLALFDLSAIAYPLILVANLGGLPLSDAKLALTLAIAALAVGLAGVFAFNQRVFRSDERWAAVFVWGCVGLLGYGAIAGGAFLREASSRAAFTAPESPAIWVEVAGVLVYAWTALEGFNAWGQARKRMRLGLADPLVANRFLLWGAMGVASLVSFAPSLAITLSGGDGSTSALARLTTACGGLAAAICLLLAFSPPAKYRAWITRRVAA